MLWGKRLGDDVFDVLENHLVDAGVAAGVLWDWWLPASAKQRLATIAGISVGDCGRLVQAAAGLHDVGKMMPAFQRQERNPHVTIPEDMDMFPHMQESKHMVEGNDFVLYR